MNSAARDVVAQLQRLLGNQPDLSFPITATKAQTWLINTFLDEARPSKLPEAWHCASGLALASCNEGCVCAGMVRCCYAHATCGMFCHS